MASRGLTVSLLHQGHALGAVHIAPGAGPAFIGGIPSADIFIPRHGFEHVGRREITLVVTDQDELRMSLLSSHNTIRVNGVVVNELVILEPGRYVLGIGPASFDLQVQSGESVTS